MDWDSPSGRRRALDESRRIVADRRRRRRRMRLYPVVVLAAGAALAIALSTRGTGTSRALAPVRVAARHRAARQQALPAVDPFRTTPLRTWLHERTGNITAAVYNVKTHRTYFYRPGVEEQTASIVKVEILATLLHQEQDEHESLGEQQREVAQGMIEASDNDDATELWDGEGGAAAVQEFDDSIGMTQTTPNAAWGLTTTTPRDQLKLLRHVLLPNRTLDAASRDYAEDLMQNVIPFDYWGVSGGVGSHATVALKNGWLPLPAGWQVNSIGSVKGSGRNYLIAVMTDQDPTEQYGIATIERISATTWRAFR
jgi:beta-lactamase class A